jgi:hypothetical protein
MSDRFTYLPWTRRADLGAASLIVRTAGQDVSMPVARLGPGDVVGIGADQFLRREPPPGSVSFQPALFPFVEFRSADLPWRLSPGSADSRGRLRPWIALVVIPSPNDPPLARLSGAPLPVVELSADQLPSLEEVSLWAHVQVPVDPQKSPSEVLETAGDRALARIISPRRLEPRTRYMACLVPTFEAGRLAGTGEDVPDPLSEAPSWTTGRVTLPIFDHWIFTTTDAGDFESLARRLKPMDLSAATRPWPIDVSTIAGDAEGHVVPFDTALVPWGWSDEWNGPARAAARDRLRQWLQRTEQASAEVPAVGPPVYGGMASATGLTEPGWTGELNLDPRLRAAAALGAEVVRRHQEELVADAWRQLGDLRRANRERDVAALAELVTTRLVVKHVQPLAEAAALTVAAPVLARRKSGETTALADVAASALPPAVLTPAFRRLALTKTSGGAPAVSTLVARMSVRVPSQGALPPAPPQLLTVDRARPMLAAFPRPTPRPPSPRPGLPRPGLPRPPTGPVVITRRETIREGVRRLSMQTARTVTLPRQKPLAFAAMSQVLSTDLSTFRIASRRFAGRLDLGDVGRDVGPTSPLVAAVEVPWPLAEPLAAIDARYLMAGIAMPADTVGLLQINPAFVAATLVGANHELIRELTWRGAKIDRRATPLRRFFDRRGSDTGAGQTDISPVAGWVPSEALDANVAVKGRAVIVLRGELVRRFPHAAVHAARAIREGAVRKPGPETKLPLFRGTITDDSMFVGFDLTPDELRGPDGFGWYVVITEQPAAPRFGLDEPGEHVLRTWNDLAWNDVALVNQYLAVSARIPAPMQPGLLGWNHDAAHMAGITYQRLVALAIHAADMLPALTPPAPPA